eukprot:CFRG0087T1
MSIRFHCCPMSLLEVLSTFRKEGWFVRDCCGIFTALLTHVFLWCAVCIVSVRAIIPMLSESPFLMLVVFIAYIFLACMAGTSHLMCMLSDPGALKKFTETPDGPDFVIDELGNRCARCTKCQVMKPYQSHHCSTCGRCIEKMDHHCPWMNNCIGRRNMKHFLLFLLYIFLTSVMSITLIVFRFFDCKKVEFVGECSHSSDIGYLGGVAFEGLLFGLFSIGMLIDSMSSLSSNTSTIDRMRNSYGVKRSCADSLADVCGESMGCTWLWPCKRSYSTSLTHAFTMAPKNQSPAVLSHTIDMENEDTRRSKPSAEGRYSDFDVYNSLDSDSQQLLSGEEDVTAP